MDLAHLFAYPLVVSKKSLHTHSEPSIIYGYLFSRIVLLYGTGPPAQCTVEPPTSLLLSLGRVFY